MAPAVRGKARPGSRRSPPALIPVRNPCLSAFGRFAPGACSAPKPCGCPMPVRHACLLALKMPLGILSLAAVKMRCGILSVSALKMPCGILSLSALKMPCGILPSRLPFPSRPPSLSFFSLPFLPPSPPLPVPWRCDEPHETSGWSWVTCVCLACLTCK